MNVFTFKSRNTMKRVGRIFILAAVCIAVAAPLGAQTVDPVVTEERTLDRESAMQRASELHAEAAAHEAMSRHFTSTALRSRRERRWNARVVELCREYAADAEKAAAAYEKLAEDLRSDEETARVATGIEPAISAPPVTAGEYRTRAADYEQRAASFRADAETHAAMQAGIAPVLNGQQQDDPSRPEARRVAPFQRPHDRAMREHCEVIIQQSLDLARRAEDMAKHYMLRARQLSASQ